MGSKQRNVASAIPIWDLQIIYGLGTTKCSLGNPNMGFANYIWSRNDEMRPRQS